MEATDPHRYSWPEGTVIEPDGTIVFRPSWANYRSKVMKAPAFLFFLLALNMFRLDSFLEALALVGGTAALSLGGIGLYFRRAMTSVGPRGLMRKRLIRQTVASKEQLGDVIFVRNLAHYDQRIDTTLLITDKEGKKVAIFNGPFWTADQLYAMASALQQPTWQPAEPVSFRDIRRRYPKAVSLAYARPIGFAFAFAFGILAATLVVVGIVFAVTG